MLSPPFALVAIWRFYWLLRRRKTCPLGMATSTMPFSATPLPYEPVFCPNGELAVP